ncbi:hypothetical protein [Salinithrix halophila]|uniref:Lipoprotein n=1 Tax=Salinithrix halophila TaxID=1485204 RepID=A0ABV8JJ16_9BACL
MAKKWNVFLCGMLTLTLAACQPEDRSHASERENGEKKSSSFHPYQEVVVPRLKELVSTKGFRKYVSKAPYILGASYDGTYLATVVYEKKAGAYRIGVYHTEENRLEEAVYAPVSERISGEKGKRESDDAEEMLRLSQETLDLGYRIKVPLHPQKSSLKRSVAGDKDGKWQLVLDHQEKGVSLTVKGKRDRWHVWQTPLEEGERIGAGWLLTELPGSQGRWTAVAYAKRQDGEVIPLVHTVDRSTLAPSWSESHLRDQTERLLGPHARIVYWGNSTSRGPDSLLAVRGESDVLQTRDGTPYRGTVSRFILFDGKGKVWFRGNSAGLVRDEKVLVDPGIPRGKELRYRVILSCRESGDGQEERILTVDQLDGRDQLIRTYELAWDPDDQRFHLISEK